MVETGEVSVAISRAGLVLMITARAIPVGADVTGLSVAGEGAENAAAIVGS